VKKTLLSCRRAMRDAEIENTDIDELVMVGRFNPHLAGT